MSIWTQCDAAGELGRPWAVVVADRRGAVGADVGGLVGREDHRHGHLDPARRRPLSPSTKSVDVAALAESAAVVGELHPHLVLARRDRLVAVDLEPLEAEEVVAVGRPALVEVEAPAAEGAALGDDHARGAALRDRRSPR